MTIKGIGSGTGSLIVAALLGERIPPAKYLLPALVLGFVAYGLSIFTYIIILLLKQEKLLKRDLKHLKRERISIPLIQH